MWLKCQSNVVIEKKNYFIWINTVPVAIRSKYQSMKIKKNKIFSKKMFPISNAFEYIFSWKLRMSNNNPVWHNKLAKVIKFNNELLSSLLVSVYYLRASVPCQIGIRIYFMCGHKATCVKISNWFLLLIQSNWLNWSFILIENGCRHSCFDRIHCVILA